MTKGPTESAYNLIKLVKRGAFGIRKFRNLRVRALLYAGSPSGHCWRQSVPAQVRRPGKPFSDGLASSWATGAPLESRTAYGAPRCRLVGARMIGINLSVKPDSSYSGRCSSSCAPPRTCWEGRRQ
ncbi:MAG: transposase [Acidimicrobiales bacterium]